MMCRYLIILVMMDSTTIDHNENKDESNCHSSVLQGCVIALTGDFGELRDHQVLQRWINLNGGQFSPSIDNAVTHLVCRSDDWVKKVEKGEHSQSWL